MKSIKLLTTAAALCGLAACADNTPKFFEGFIADASMNTVTVKAPTADVTYTFSTTDADKSEANGLLPGAPVVVDYTGKLEDGAAATKIAEEENIKLQYGVYVGGTGPTFETQAEYRYFKAIGGDAAGMSTVPEVIVARHMSIPVFGVSVITNCGLSDEVGDHEDVQRQGKKAGVRMEVLFRKMIKNLQ